MCHPILRCRCLQDICFRSEGNMLPEQAFMYVGAIEQAEEQAKKMAAKS